MTAQGSFAARVAADRDRCGKMAAEIQNTTLLRHVLDSNTASFF